MIKAFTINNDVWLLLRQVSLKRAEVVLNFTNDTAYVLDNTVDLICTSMDHTTSGNKASD